MLKFKIHLLSSSVAPNFKVSCLRSLRRQTCETRSHLPTSLHWSLAPATSIHFTFNGRQKLNTSKILHFHAAKSSSSLAGWIRALTPPLHIITNLTCPCNLSVATPLITSGHQVIKNQYPGRRVSPQWPTIRWWTEQLWLSAIKIKN